MKLRTLGCVAGMAAGLVGAAAATAADQKALPKVVDFGDKFCIPCKLMAPALEELKAMIEVYEPPEPPQAEVKPRAGRATWATEAPRGTLYHRYDVASDGTIVAAKIVPPTSQNLRHMEKDLWDFLPGVLDPSDEDLTRLAEMVVRNYDPCISCATHFLRLEIERV